MRRWFHGGRPRFGEPPVREDVRRELDAHIALRVEELVRDGWTEEAARDEARRAFGDYERVRRECEREVRSHDRAVRRTMGREAVMQDVRYAVRSLLADPAFAVVAVVTLALGIGANSAIFSVLHGVLLKPLPFANADRLVYVAEAHDGPSAGPGPVPWVNFRDWEEGARSFEAMAAYSTWTSAVIGGDRPIQAVGSVVSEDFWDVMQPDLLMGRVTSPEEHVEGTGATLVISERFWRTHLGSDPDVLGRTLEVSGSPAVVVGVLEAGFHFPDESEMWTPTELRPQSQSRTAHNYDVVGLLAEGVEPETADAELDRVSARMVEGLPDDDYDVDGAIVTSLKERIAGDTPGTLYLLMGAAVLLLLVAATNLSSTLLARGVRRSRELAVRASLGAGRGRLVRQLLTESAVLATAGAVAGLLLATGLVEAMRRFEAGSIPRLEEVGLHPTVLAFTLGVAVLTTFLCGLVPALRASDGDPGRALRSGSRGNAGVRRGLWRLLVGAEVALALALLVGGGLLVRSFAEVMRVDPGYATQGVLTAEIELSGQRYPELQAYADFYRQLVERLERSPAVERAAVASTVPLRGWLATGSVHKDYVSDDMTDSHGAYVAVSPGYFDALGIEIVRGRGFTDADDASAPHVVIVSEAWAEALWPGEDPLGKAMTGGGMDNYWQDRVWAEVVGVVEDAKYRSLTGSVDPAYYFPVYQRPFRTRFGAMTVVRSRPEALTEAAGLVRETVADMDPTVPVDIRTMRERVSASVADRQFVLFVLAGFAVVALLLAAVGIYGVVSYLVASRTREMGIRLALGETPGSVRKRVVLGALAMVTGGLVVGGAGALAGGRVVRSFLYGVEPADPVTLGGVVAVLVLTAVTAAWVPAVRATRVDPLAAMRAE